MKRSCSKQLHTEQTNLAAYDGHRAARIMCTQASCRRCLIYRSQSPCTPLHAAASTRCHQHKNQRAVHKGLRIHT